MTGQSIYAFYVSAHARVDVQVEEKWEDLSEQDRGIWEDIAKSVVVQRPSFNAPLIAQLTEYAINNLVEAQLRKADAGHLIDLALKQVRAIRSHCLLKAVQSEAN